VCLRSAEACSTMVVHWQYIGDTEAVQGRLRVRALETLGTGEYDYDIPECVHHLSSRELKSQSS
jgi:hypothetical protein